MQFASEIEPSAKSDFNRPTFALISNYFHDQANSGYFHDKTKIFSAKIRLIIYC